ncbi:ABC transporter permease [Prolixibacteraceae bacterium JC049]|nr:ABC transporter permease [Prolixibacteraceae bacterium JC049]
MSIRNLKSFIKFLANNKLYTFITIAGFSISLMFVILLSIFIQKEYSVDQFHVNKDRLYRMVHDDYSGFAPPSGALLKNTFPEVESYTRMYGQEGVAQARGDKKYGIKFLMADSAFFNMFSYPLIKGEPSSVLVKRKSIVLTKSMALKMFDELPDLGTMISINGDHQYELTGIMKDLPRNTHLTRTDAIVDFNSLANLWNHPGVLTSYGNNSFGLYVMAKKGVNLPSKSPQMLTEFKKVNWMFKNNFAKNLSMEPITEVYFSKSYSSGVRQNNKVIIQILLGITVLILILAVVNYVNLTIAQASFRHKELAIKKLMGSKRWAFWKQYIQESTLLCLFSFVIGLILSLAAENIFNYLLSTELNLTSAFSSKEVLIALLGILLIGAISGLVPAIKVAGVNPIDIVKGIYRMQERTVYSKMLITFQYVLISGLLVSALFINKQSRYIQNRDLGFDKENIIVMRSRIPSKKLESFKQLIKNIPGVKQISYSRGNPINGGNNNSFVYKEKQMSFQHFMVDSTYFDMMGMEVKLTGAAYSPKVAWVNETALKVLGLPEDAKEVEISGRKSVIYGIVKDFHFRDLKTAIGPAFFTNLPSGAYPWDIQIKVNSSGLGATVDRIKAAYNEFNNGIPAEINFMDDSIAQWYEQDRKLGKTINYFTALTIIISVMGLFAMSLFYIQQKIKEIGIRKVNGAKISEVLLLLNKDFLRWALFGFVLACPIAYYGINKWLETFAYKTTLSWWIFAISGVAAFMIALLSVTYQSWKAASRNPVEALRYE